VLCVGERRIVGGRTLESVCGVLSTARSTPAHIDAVERRVRRRTLLADFLVLGVWHTLGVPMREDCRHFGSRTYDDGEVARFCVLDLAPEAPWRCPENCPQYERTVIDATFVRGSLAPTEVEDEPEEKAEDIEDLLDDAEMIVDAAEPAALADLDGARGRDRKWWQLWKRARPDDGDDWHLSSR